MRGGGVLIAVSNLLVSEAVSLSSTLDIEFTGILVKLKYKRIFVTCSYIPPNSPETIYQKHSDAISTVVNMSHLNDIIIAVGDFNMPMISWKFST